MSHCSKARRCAQMLLRTTGWRRRNALGVASCGQLVARAVHSRPTSLTGAAADVAGSTAATELVELTKLVKLVELAEALTVLDARSRSGVSGHRGRSGEDADAMRGLLCGAHTSGASPVLFRNNASARSAL